MVYYEKERLVKELENEVNIKAKVKSLEKDLSQLDILKLASYLKDSEKKQFIFDYYVFENPYINYENLAMYLRCDEDRMCLINSLLKYNAFMSAYDVAKVMSNPKALDEKVLRMMLCSCKNISVDDVVKDFDLLFIDELINMKDYYNLLKYKNKLSYEMVNKICLKSFSSLDDYKKITSILNAQERKKYVKLFLDSMCDNASVANQILKNKDYEKEDHERLILIICHFGKADVIYDVLMREDLSDMQTKMFEKALLNTNNIEYIAYYYFYKNKEKFNLLFGSSLLFLSYVLLNEDKFTNKTILEDVKNKIRLEENENLTLKVRENITYTKKKRGC